MFRRLREFGLFSAHPAAFPKLRPDEVAQTERGHNAEGDPLEGVGQVGTAFKDGYRDGVDLPSFTWRKLHVVPG